MGLWHWRTPHYEILRIICLSCVEVRLSIGPIFFYSDLHAIMKRAKLVTLLFVGQLSLEFVLSVFPFSLQHFLKVSICTSKSALVSIPLPTARNQGAKQMENSGSVANLFLALSPIPLFEETIVKPRIFRCDYVIKPTLPSPPHYGRFYLHIQYQIFSCP
ncbi:hypothetical protein B9Z19DRAFT_632706 [Tuber borchii]|uniref:Uncharacterized protein n=1 Tax=Tuber borchii TaxID=42251 RepID=A0A2T7A0I5_TUBBO|nr:hypothetical protein B9Z19DRAFT_632706 [Tuber borchii]